jgi:hypothetical protein
MSTYIVTTQTVVTERWEVEAESTEHAEKHYICGRNYSVEWNTRDRIVLAVKNVRERP